MPLHETIAQFLKEHNISSNDKLLVAVSAGMDSMVLLHALHQLGQPLHVAHVNHSKRAESDEEEIFVQDWCAQRVIPVSIKRLNPEDMPAGNNFQDWARQQRYAFFNEVAEKESCDCIATAHHFNDKVETFLGHALRGSGLNGLSSLREVEANIIRPLLGVSHEVLKNYAHKKNLEWREDASNQTDDYQRNRIRHHILPNLDDVSETWQQGIKNTFANLERERTLLLGFINDWAEKNCIRNSNTVKINLVALTIIPAPSALLYHLLSEKDSGFNWIALANSPNDAVGSFYFGKTNRALRDREWLIIAPMGAKEEAPVEISSDTTHVKHPLQLRLSHVMRDEHTRPEIGIACAKTYFNPVDALLDAEKLAFPLILRSWQVGDKFVPLGMKGTKLISDYLIDVKIPRSQKEKTFVLTSGNEIVWLVGHRINEHYKVGADTQIMYLARLLKEDE